MLEALEEKTPLLLNSAMGSELMKRLPIILTGLFILIQRLSMACPSPIVERVLELHRHYNFAIVGGCCGTAPAFIGKIDRRTWEKVVAGGIVYEDIQKGLY